MWRWRSVRLSPESCGSSAMSEALPAAGSCYTIADGPASDDRRGPGGLRPRGHGGLPPRGGARGARALRAHLRARARPGLVRRRRARGRHLDLHPPHHRARRDRRLRGGDGRRRPPHPSPPRPADRAHAPPAAGRPRARRGRGRAVGVGGGDLRALRLRPGGGAPHAARAAPGGAAGHAAATRRAAARRPGGRPPRGDAAGLRARARSGARGCSTATGRGGTTACFDPDRRRDGAQALQAVVVEDGYALYAVKPAFGWEGPTGEVRIRELVAATPRARARAVGVPARSGPHDDAQLDAGAGR